MRQFVIFISYTLTLLVKFGDCDQFTSNPATGYLSTNLVHDPSNQPNNEVPLIPPTGYSYHNHDHLYSHPPSTTSFQQRDYQTQSYTHMMRPGRGKKRLKCYMTEDGMKCKKRRRDGGGDSYGMPMLSYSYGPPKGGTSGWGSSDDDEDDSGGSIGGLSGLIGLLGLTGLKGLKGLLGLAVFIPFLPFLLPLLLPLLLLPLLLPLLLLGLVLLLPVIVVGRRRSGSSGSLSTLEDFSRLGELAMKVLQSGECVEKITCELAKGTKPYNLLGYMERAASSLPKDNPVTLKVNKGLGQGRVGDCVKFTCKPDLKAAQDNKEPKELSSKTITS